MSWRFKPNIHTKNPKLEFAGIFQNFRDAIKLFSKEQHLSLDSNYFIHYFSPTFRVLSFFVGLAVVSLF
jgi:NADH:ubiquinone oxidoreductase subunit H